MHIYTANKTQTLRFISTIFFMRTIQHPRAVFQTIQLKNEAMRSKSFHKEEPQVDIPSYGGPGVADVILPSGCTTAGLTSAEETEVNNGIGSMLAPSVGNVDHILQSWRHRNTRTFQSYNGGKLETSVNASKIVTWNFISYPLCGD